ncbi:MAG: hypothetical protein NZL98_01645, partial [Anaerolineales bacterium]|nr:hypothetical protein [Anaerolineales bacterium]
MAIRILHVVDTLETGGLETGVVNLICNMAPSRFSHIICAVRNVGTLAERLPKDRTTVLQLEHPSGRLPVHTPQLLQIIRKVKP